ncbi:tRNA (guanosine(37)-N1)-methyltransferase TrmD [Jeotgalibacillus proteolyticus]|uniref:tRNA (guanine-N(1)-)-methyltransferase n=1 Tax=Jeotgalibacillus proteolyticus TaxID=2082395 RepID=A0A2S5GGN8_9BACL|nr:tRNA (guanosine(37)-N1)-methyltransferase TrmD [Jeotgalibacillus proteolyticus]PPA72075.1 tRNA (guanosine(37)-N1)-methyltransferase TrmD [Jeotgalibacillus proteolyticus]
MKIDVLSLFPSMFQGVFGESILKKAQEKKAVELDVIDFREFSPHKQKSVDDYPYGGGAGMVLKPEPIFEAIDHVTSSGEKKPRVILLCPQGETYTQKKAEELSNENHLVFICGHYEGYDERIRENLVTDEISIGDFVLTGGELGAMVIIDSVVRLLPEVLGNAESAEKDSFSSGLLEHPHYTRPAVYRGLEVPGVLTSGNHAHIEEWRMKESLKRTWERRPDLLESYPLSQQQKDWIIQLEKEKKRVE